MLTGATVSAQQVNTDSLKIVSNISEYQLKLGKLQNTIDQKTQNKQDGAVKAQVSANQNLTDANRLSNDPQNKKDAKQAENAAGEAKSDAKKARKATDELNKLNKKIAYLQIKISDEKVKLSRYTDGSVTTVTAPVQQDTTIRP
jgi:predicted RNase H-like nuclease (RuvC/YqgF family)